MAIYEYRCSACGNEFERTRPISEAGEPATCPSCGGSGTKLPSLFGSTSGYGIKVPARQAFRHPPSAPQRPARRPRRPAKPS